MSGESLHKYDKQLCAYAVDLVAGHMERPRFAQGMKKALASRPLLLAYLLNAADRSRDASDERLLLSDGELMSLAGAVEGGVNLLWEPDASLHRRYVETITDVRNNLSRQAAEDWSEDCARFGRQLGEDRLLLTEGIDIVRQWVRRLRYFLRAMGAIDLLPQSEGGSPTPTMPVAVPVAPLDPRHVGLTAVQVADIERMRQAIEKHPNGKAAPVKSLIGEAQISNQRGRKALRWLQQHEGYQGFTRPHKTAPSGPEKPISTPP